MNMWRDDNIASGTNHHFGRISEIQYNQLDDINQSSNFPKKNKIYKLFKAYIVVDKVF